MAVISISKIFFNGETYNGIFFRGEPQEEFHYKYYGAEYVWYGIFKRSVYIWGKAMEDYAFFKLNSKLIMTNALLYFLIDPESYAYSQVTKQMTLPTGYYHPNFAGKVSDGGSEKMIVISQNRSTGKKQFLICNDQFSLSPIDLEESLTTTQLFGGKYSFGSMTIKLRTVTEYFESTHETKDVEYMKLLLYFKYSNGTIDPVYSEKEYCYTKLNNGEYAHPGMAEANIFNATSTFESEDHNYCLANMSLIVGGTFKNAKTCIVHINNIDGIDQSTYQQVDGSVLGMLNNYCFTQKFSNNNFVVNIYDLSANLINSVAVSDSDLAGLFYVNKISSHYYDGYYYFASKAIKRVNSTYGYGFIFVIRTDLKKAEIAKIKITTLYNDIDNPIVFDKNTIFYCTGSGNNVSFKKEKLSKLFMEG